MSSGAQLAGEAKEAGAQVVDDASKKVEEVKDAAHEKVDQAKEAGAQLADDAAKKADEAKNTIVEKAQEIGHVVSVQRRFQSVVNRRVCSRWPSLCKPYRLRSLARRTPWANSSQQRDNG